MSKSGDKEPDFPYTHLWVDAEGETHITHARFKGFEKKSYAADPQVRSASHPAALTSGRKITHARWACPCNMLEMEEDLPGNMWRSTY